MLVPLAVPVRRTFEHPVLLLGRELVPGRVTRNACRLGVAHQVVLAFLPSRGLHGLDGARAQGELVVGNHQAIVHTHHAAKTTAGLAGTHGGIEGKHGRNRVGVTPVAAGAMQAGGKTPIGRRVGGCGCGCGRSGVRLRQHIHVQAPAAAFERQLDGLQHARFVGALHAKPVCHHVQHLAHRRRGCGCRLFGFCGAGFGR